MSMTTKCCDLSNDQSVRFPISKTLPKATRSLFYLTSFTRCKLKSVRKGSSCRLRAKMQTNCTFWRVGSLRCTPSSKEVNLSLNVSSRGVLSIIAPFSWKKRVLSICVLRCLLSSRLCRRRKCRRFRIIILR